MDEHEIEHSQKQSRRNSNNLELQEHVAQMHICTLPPEQDPIIKFINSGNWVHSRRKFRNFCTVADNNPRSRIYLKSTVAIENEKIRHFQHFYYVIHPLSGIRQIWETIMIFVILFYVLITPIYLVYENGDYLNRRPYSFSNNYFIIRIMVLTPILIIDLLSNFITGYCIYDTKEIVLSYSKIAANYILGLFFVYLLSILPLDCVLFNVIPIAKPREEINFYVTVSSINHILLIFVMFKYLNNFRDWLEINNYTVKLAKLCCCYIIILMWMSSFMLIMDMEFFSEKTKRENITKNLLFISYKCVYIVFMIGYGFNSNPTTLNKIVDVLCLVIGMCLKFVLISYILQLYNKYSSATSKFQLLQEQLQEFMNYKVLPENIRKRILHYYEFRFRKKYLREKEIWDILSGHLKQEIVMYSCRRLIEKVDFFKDLPLPLLVRIVKCMKQEFYLPNDIIVSAGSVGDAMYFIASGTVAVFLKTGKEVCHLEDGTHFGEISMVMENECRTASIVAVEPCELFNLQRKDFQKAVEPYPHLMDRIRKIAHDRFQRTMELIVTEEKIKKDEVPF